jgi:hypothetical protein
MKNQLKFQCPELNLSPGFGGACLSLTPLRLKNKRRVLGLPWLHLKHYSSALVWDVAGLVNRPLPAVVKPAEADLQRWWAELRAESPGEAYKASRQVMLRPRGKVVPPSPRLRIQPVGRASYLPH